MKSLTPNYLALVEKFIGRGVTPCLTPMLPMNATQRQIQTIKNHAKGLTAHGKPMRREIAK